MKTKYFDFDFTENSLEIKKIPFSTKQIVINLLFCVFMFALFVFLAVVSFIGHLPVFFKIAGPTAAVISIVIGVDTIFHGRYRPSVLIYRIDSLGITHRDVNATYTIAWSEIETFGFVDNNLRFLQGQSTQICLYFSKKSYSKRRLKMRFNLVGLNLFGHCSSDDMIVFALKEPFMDDELYLRIMNIINLYCDGSKRVDFLGINNFPQ